MNFPNIRLAVYGVIIFLIYITLLHPITGFLGGLPLFLFGFTILPNASLVLIAYGLTPTFLNLKISKTVIFISLYFFVGWLLVADNFLNFDPTQAVVNNKWDMANSITQNPNSKVNPYYQQIGFGADEGCGCSYWITSDGSYDRGINGLGNNFLSNAYELFTHATIPSYLYMFIASKFY